MATKVKTMEIYHEEKKTVIEELKGELDSMRNYTYKLFEIMNQAGFGKSQSKDSAQSAA